MSALDEGYPAGLADLIDKMREEVRVLTARIENAEITPAEWQTNMEALIARYSMAAWLVGADATLIDDFAMQFIVEQLTSQYSFLDNFALVIQSSEDFMQGWYARADMYANAIVAPYWRGKTKMLPLPTMPGQDSQCMCITTPESRVLTSEGLKPISNIIVGDMVYTHRGNWKKVIKVFRNKPNEKHRQAWIKTPSGKLVGCTTDHRWLTPVGWRNSIDIDNNGLSMYSISYENMRDLWEDSRKQEQNGYLPVLQDVLPLREKKRLPFRRMRFLWNEAKSIDSMERKKRIDTRRNTEIRNETKENVLGFTHRYKLGRKKRWKAIRLFLGEWKKEIHLPLSIGMDTCERTNTGWYGNSSHKQRPYRRPTRKLTNDERYRTPSSAYGSGIERFDDEGSKQESKREKTVLLQELREAIYGIQSVQGWKAERQSILFTGMLSQGTILYDVEVEDDHSFIVEGLVCHNSNCACGWDITTVDEEKGDYDCYWVLNAQHIAKIHCQTCIERGREWNPLQIRNNELVLIGAV